MLEVAADKVRWCGREGCRLHPWRYYLLNLGRPLRDASIASVTTSCSGESESWNGPGVPYQTKIGAKTQQQRWGGRMKMSMLEECWRQRKLAMAHFGGDSFLPRF